MWEGAACVVGDVVLSGVFCTLRGVLASFCCVLSCEVLEAFHAPLEIAHLRPKRPIGVPCGSYLYTSFQGTNGMRPKAGVT